MTYCTWSHVVDTCRRIHIQAAHVTTHKYWPTTYSFLGATTAHARCWKATSNSMWRNLSSLVTNLYLVAIFTTMTSPLATPTAEHVKPDRDSDMANTERTFIMVKPDGVQRGLIADIMKRFEQKGFKLVALKMMKVNRYLYICTPACTGVDDV